TARRSARFPLAVMSLAEALDGQHVATVLDGNIDRDFITTATRLVAEGHVDVVGVTIMGGPQLRSGIAVSRAIRARAPTLPIVWGGAFPTNCPEATLRVPYVDYAVRGQGEDTFVELLAALAARDQTRLPQILGLTWRRGEEIVHNRLRPFTAKSLARALP